MNLARMLCMPLLALALAGAAAHAQHGGGGPGGGGPGGRGPGGGMPGGMGDRGPGMPGGGGGPLGNGGPPPNNGGPAGGMRGGLQMGPPGRWWDDKKFAKGLGLNSDQQKRMDAVFSENRNALAARYESLKSAESKLESLTRAAHLNEGALFAEIDHVAQARAELEKVNTHMLLQIRDEMTPDQISRLEEHR